MFPTAIASSAPRLPVRARPPPNTSLTAGFALALPSRQIFNAFCSRKALQPDAVRFLFDGSRINPNQTPKDVRSATRPAASLPPRAPARESDREGCHESGCPEATVPRTEKHFFPSGPIASAPRENLTSPPLSRAARHGGRRLHRRDDGAGRRTLSAREDRGARARLRREREETRFSSVAPS